MRRLGCIGTGNMGFAILNAVSAQKERQKVLSFDRQRSHYSELAEMGVEVCTSVQPVVEQSDYLFMAVKPQDYGKALQEVRPFISHRTVVVSIVAGITEEWICSRLGFQAKVILVMPNTPILISKGAATLCAGKEVTQKELAFVENIFQSAGVVEKVRKNEMNAMIPLHGSAPAYIFLFAKAFIEYAQEEDLDEKAATRLFCASLSGAAQMMLQSGHSLEELIQAVCSPGGATLAGMDVLEECGFTQAIQKACKACRDRAEQLQT